MFVIRWLGADGLPTGHTTEAEGATTYAEAVWEATKILRSVTKDNREGVNAGLYPVGFIVEKGEA